MILDATYQQLKKRFQNAGIDTAAIDARVLICYVLNYTHEEFVLHNNKTLSDNDLRMIDAIAAQRLSGKPVAKIIGKKEFYGRDFITSEDTLDPRPDSEILIETVLARYAKNDTIKILDLGTGTGCLLLTLLCEMPQAQGIAVDQSVPALEVAKRNAVALAVEDRALFIKSDWLTEVAGQFDVIISNPPYIPAGDIPGLAADVRLFDPMSALDGGADGLNPYRLIIPQLPRFLKPGGLVAFELGQGQHQQVMDMLAFQSFHDVASHTDLAGIRRIVSGIWLQKADKSV